MTAAILLAGCAVALLWVGLGRPSTGEPIKVGILHSETGTMAISEKSVRDSTLLAIAEINASGGLLGRRLEPVVVDGKSDPRTFAVAAERLIVEQKVSVVFGCWTSACRKTVRPIFERHNHLLFYPVQSEGLEQSPNIIYTGAAPNQQILPAVNWCFQQLKARKFYLVGSDYVFPRTAHAIIEAQVNAMGGEIVGQQYILLGSDEVDEVVQQIVTARPDVILNTINGDSNVAFFAALRRAGVTSDEIPTVSFSLAESELHSMNAEAVAGDYAAWNYFQSVDREENHEFVRRFQQKYGSNRVTDDPIEAGYFGVYLWAQAVQDAGTDDVSEVRRHMANQSFPAPQGIVSIDANNGHTWKTVRIGRIRNDGQFDIVWTSGRPLRPVPYPVYRTRKQWDDFLAKLNDEWGGQWANPGN
ncbi:MAG: urea ABC transporter substrate-binding protein [Planctomycetota bacterium]